MKNSQPKSEPITIPTQTSTLKNATTLKPSKLSHSQNPVNKAWSTMENVLSSTGMARKPKGPR